MAKDNTIKQNITQFFLIVFSVVLGLYLSERIEERKKIQESEELLTTIKSEVKDNIKLMEIWAPYHEEIFENFDSLSKNEAYIAKFINDKTIFFELLTKRTFIGRYPANDAWDIGKSHPLIVKIDHDKLLILSKIYSQQKLTFDPLMEVLDLYSSKDVNTEKDAKSNLALLSDRLRELVALEKQLMYYYKQGEEILELKIDREVED